MDSLEGRRLLAADLVISEFLAANGSGLTDSFGDHSDWVEIHNRGDAAADLGQYALTDDATLPLKWRFPTVSLAAGGYLLVFASDRNIAVAGQQLHTNFKLGAGGEYMGLMHADGSVQFDYAPSFPAQTTDISYGLSDENSTNSSKQFFGTPTPGAVNVTSAAAPVFSVPGKIITAATTVTLSATTPGAVIRVTTDGSDPTAMSPIYGAPFTISTTRTLRARTFAPGRAPSPTVTHTYVRVDASMANFDSNVGTVVLDTFGSALNDTTMVRGSGTFIDNRGDGHAGITDTADYSGRIGIRIRGSSSQNFAQKSFAIETWDDSNEDKKVPLLGMPVESDWTLIAPYSEKSLMQNALAFGWGSEAGLLTPRFRYVEVFLNTTGDSSLSYDRNYVGVYLLMEKIKIGPNRVNIAEIGPSDNAEPAVTGGYLWKKDRIDPDEQVINTNSGQPFAMVDPETLTVQQRTWLTNHLNEFESALFGSNYKDPVNGYAKYIDVDNWVNTWLMVEMTKNIDAYRLSSFYYKDRGGKIKMGPMWDYNLSLGNAWYFDGSEPANFYTEAFSDFDIPYIRRLMSDPAFKQKVVDRWAELRRTNFSTPDLMADVDARVQELTDGNGNYPVGPNPTQASNNAVVRNAKRWNTLGVYNWPNGYFDLQGRWIQDVQMMKDWLKARVDWMDSRLLLAPQLSKAGGQYSTPTTVAITPYRVTNTEVTLIGAASPVKAFLPSSELTGWNNTGYNTAGWLSGTGGVGYDTSPSPVNYNPLIGLNVSQMRNTRNGVYTRYEFNVADPAAIESLILKLKYDDGIVAYLNGHRVASDNDAASFDIFGNPYATHWNNQALSARDDGLAVQAREFDISALKSLLVAGTNVLAIHGMNNSIDSSDLLIAPELVSRMRVAPSPAAGTQVYYTLDGSDPLAADRISLSPSALLYSGPITIAATTRLRARSVTAGVWSGMSDALYSFATDTLRVSEIMYNPANPPAGSAFTAQDFEFIEVRNAGNVPLNLQGYAFTQGITFDFPNMTLPANGVSVIVKNLAAFQSRYGTGVVPLGVYTGSLDNSGEVITLMNPLGTTAQSFTFDDDWYKSTDGGGTSLEADGTLTDDLNLAANWRSSTIAGGTPGSLTTIDRVSPKVMTILHLFEAAPNQIAVRFNENVSASLGLTDFAAVNLTTGSTLAPTAVSFDPDTLTATLVFAASPTAMADGDYRLTIAAAGVADASGNLLDGDGDGTPDGDRTFDFFVMAGDINRDRKVDFADLVILAQNYNQSGKIASQGNVDYSEDGRVDFNDLVLLAQRYGQTLSPLAPLAVLSPSERTSKPTRTARVAEIVL